MIQFDKTPIYYWQVTVPTVKWSDTSNTDDTGYTTSSPGTEMGRYNLHRWRWPHDKFSRNRNGQIHATPMTLVAWQVLWEQKWRQYNLHRWRWPHDKFSRNRNGPILATPMTLVAWKILWEQKWGDKIYTDDDDCTTSSPRTEMGRYLLHRWHWLHDKFSGNRNGAIQSTPMMMTTRQVLREQTWTDTCYTDCMTLSSSLGTEMGWYNLHWWWWPHDKFSENRNGLILATPMTVVAWQVLWEQKWDDTIYTDDDDRTTISPRTLHSNKAKRIESPHDNSQLTLHQPSVKLIYNNDTNTVEKIKHVVVATCRGRHAWFTTKFYGLE